eukprot:TRINITY_DN7599_c0_g1_i15.p1 TRINITY_DN7599_c0_g1~~TRINITY_DN7599_c0_g1_i15.p1  ORF type:complete len:578 (-),score=70.43 TRINITY_DN7599_c0_g1_i15:27-1760(-)
MEVETGTIGDNTIPCCMCGAMIRSNPANMCINCLKSRVDITEGIPKMLQIFWCRGCNRYQAAKWIAAALDSQELLAILMKKIKGLTKVTKLVEAGFVYTEPHSRRLKVKLTIQKEVFNFATLQQTFIVEFQVQNLQCPDCARSYTDHVWKAVCQVRQKVKHKKTFFYLEQLLLKHNICEKVIGLKEQTDGLDFYWDSKASATRQLEFLQGVVPVRSKHSKRLISQDDNSNKKNYKFTIVVEISPICKDDVVCLSPQIADQFGGVSPLMLCYKITSLIHLVDPTSLKLIDIPAGTFFRYPFSSLFIASQLVEFIVLDVEQAESEVVRTGRSVEALDRNPMHIQNKQTKTNEKLTLAEVEVAKKADFGQNDTTYRVLTHLGHLLKSGDTVLGYDLSHANLTDEALKSIKSKHLRKFPEILLVKKYYARKNRAKKRQWQLKTLKKSGPDRPLKKAEEKQLEAEREEFLQEIEEDPELRMNVNLYKKKDPILPKKKGTTEIKTKEEPTSGKKEKKTKSKLAKKAEKKKAKSKGKAPTATTGEASEAGDEESGDELPEIPMEEIGRAVQQECRDRSRMPSSA